MNKPVKIVLGALVAIILGSAIGIGSTFLTVKIGAAIGGVKNGPWRTNLSIGSREANMYTRAVVAVHGLFALNHSETIYYSAMGDDSGQSFSGDNVYRIEGKAPEARWWSITAYGADDFLIPNEQNLYSYSSKSVMYDRNGKFTIYVSKNQKPGNWLPLGNQKKFVLSLRLYNPGESIRKNPATVSLPHIFKEGDK
jgi:hypothetical protein